MLNYINLISMYIYLLPFLMLDLYLFCVLYDHACHGRPMNIKDNLWKLALSFRLADHRLKLRSLGLGKHVYLGHLFSLFILTTCAWYLWRYLKWASDPMKLKS